MAEEQKQNEVNIDSSQKSLEETERKAEEYLNGWQRAKADFLNYKKAEMERVGTLLGFAIEELILKILPVMDNFELAEKNLPDDLKKNDHVKGFLQIKKQVSDFLKFHGIEEVKTKGEKFDPSFMEAVAEQDGSKPGGVMEEVQKGYKIGDKLLRPAKVKISK